VPDYAVWTDFVLKPPPTPDQDLGFPQGIEDISIQQIVPELTVEALVVSVLRWRAGISLEGRL
jgi:hypothetical protein